ncbi:unnamed protein product [Anisakis simplex]|uniref:RUN domain-containing protein n=1 Tax=Anisakis simplex TaxID=6269 RepID=A0A0M3JZA3_ANISI|nr:unnamed protein product [Anisakis simplex]
MTNADVIKANLSKELKLVAKNTSDEADLNGSIPDCITQTLCNIVEAIFIHGLKDPFFVRGSRYAKYPEPNFWPLLHKYTHVSIMNQITTANHIKSDIGKARAWIRIVLNEHALEHYLNLFWHDPISMCKYYDKSAYLRDLEHFNLMVGCVKSMSEIDLLHIPINSPFLNAWTPTPLILSGLVAGKPARLEQLRPRRRDQQKPSTEFSSSAPENDNQTEVAESALDLIEPPSQHSLLTASSAFNGTAAAAEERSPAPSRPLSRGLSCDDDDVSSVYSHPSMLDGGLDAELRIKPSFIHQRTAVILDDYAPSSRAMTTPNQHSHYPLSSTPHNQFISALLPRTLQNCDSSSPSHEVRVLRRRHRVRRTSKSSSEDGSRSRSDETATAPNDPSFKNDFGITLNIPRSIEEEEKDINGALATSAKMNISKIVGIKSVSVEDAEEGNDEECSESEIVKRKVLLNSVLQSTYYLDQPKQTVGSSLNDEDDNNQREKVGDGIAAAAEPIPIPSNAVECNLVLSPSSEISAISLQEELLNVGVAENEHETSGNSLLGKGWTNHPPLNVVQSDGDGAFLQSGQSSSNGTADSSHNFDVMMRNTVAVCDDDYEEMETKVRSRLDSEMFADTLNESIVSGIEIGRASISEKADEGSLIATSTIMPLSCGTVTAQTANRKGSSSERAIIVNEADMNGEDEYGISRAMIPLLTTIPREKGLDQQNFRCASCNRSIGPTFADYMVCALDAKYYCDGCWRKGDTSVIPSRLIHNWDSYPRQICRANMSFLNAIADRPIIRIDKVNMHLYEHCAAMQNIKFLREKMALAVMYLLTCRESVADDLRMRLWPKEYLFSDIHLYSFTDLLSVLSGQLERHLQSIINYAIDHIHRCLLCAQKGFVCEICDSKQVIYPFQMEVTYRCSKCYSVFHKECIGERQCPKCLRREQYAKQPDLSPEHLPLD